MLLITKSDFNKDFDNYLSKRLSGSMQKNSFFRKVESMIPQKGNSEDMPSLAGGREAIAYGEKQKPFLSRIFAHFYSRNERRKVIDDFEDEDLPENVREDVEHIERDIGEIDEEVEELEDEREGLLRRLFKRMFSSNVEEEADEDIDPELVNEQLERADEQLKHETKLVLKFVHKWLSKLPPDHIDAFKRSPDFEAYRDLLEKYDLIKK